MISTNAPGVRKAFDAVAPTYAASRAGNLALELIKERALGRLTAGLPRGAAILDAGCGPGLEAARLAEAGFAVTALDVSPAMIGQARRRLAPWIRRGRVRLVRGDFSRAPAGPFAAILCLRSTNFAPSLAPVARLARRVLAPGGRLVFTTAMPCSWQAIAGGLLRLDPAGAFRRLAPRGVPLAFGGVPVRAWAPSLHAALAPFRSRFRLARVEPLGLLLPDPARWRPGWRRLSALWRLADVLERHAGPLAPLADHALVIVVRR